MATIVTMPRIGLNEQESVIGEMRVKEGDRVAKGDELFTVETDKSTLSVYAETGGTVLKCYHQSLDTVRVLAPVCVIGESGEDVPEPKGEKAEADELENTQTQATHTPEPKAQPTRAGETRISPRAKRLAEQNGVELSGIRPGGAQGRIVEQDVIRALEGRGEEAREEKETRALPGIRRVIAKNMMASLHNMAQLTSTTLFDASQMLSLRAAYKKQGKDITIGDLLLYGTAKTLEQAGEMNAHMPNESEIILFKDVHLGFAVDTERGLLVPTIPNANRMTIEEISKQAASLSAACRTGRISPDALRNATFTVTNLGSLGIRTFTPIINPPQIGILGVGCIDTMAKATENGMAFYPACHLSLTYDHRAIDGAPSARFLKRLCENLENIKNLI